MAANHPCWASIGCVFALLLTTVASLHLGSEPGKEALVQLLHVESGSELLDALNRSSVEWVGIKQDVVITEADTQPYGLPLVIAGNRTVVIASVDGTRKTLDLGGVLQLLWLESNSYLGFQNLELQGGASVEAARQAGIPREPQVWVPVFPTIDGDSGHEVSFINVVLDRTKAGCTKELMDTIAAAFRQLLGPDAPGKRLSDLSLFLPGNITFPSVLIDPATSEEVSRSLYFYLNLTLNCVEDVGAGQPNGTHDHQGQHVGTPAQLLAALGQSEVESIYIVDDIYLTQADWEIQRLPIVIASGRNLTLVSDDGLQKTLDFGGALGLLWLHSSSQVNFKALKLQGLPLAEAAVEAGLSTDMPIFTPSYPMLTGADGYTVAFDDVVFEKVRRGCSADTISNLADSLREFLGSPRNSSVSNVGESLHVSSVTMEQAILNMTTRAEVGSAQFIYNNFTIYCLEYSASDAGEEKDDAGAAGGSTSSDVWVWALVGSLAGLALVVAACGFALLRVRRARRAGPAAEKVPSSDHMPGLSLASLGGRGPLLVMEAGEGTPPSSDVGSAGRRNSGPLGPEVPAGLGPNTIWNARVGPIAGLELGELIGKGCYGRVYRGRWKGALVAVKVMEQYVGKGGASRLAREPLLSVSLSHPCVVCTYKLAVVCVKPDEPMEVSDAAEQDPGKGDSALDRRSEQGLDGSGAAGDRANGGGSKWAQLSSGRGASESGTPGGGAGSSGAAGGGRLGLDRKGSEKSISGSAKSVAAAASSFLGAWPREAMPSGIYETVLVMEYCDRGSLTDAMKAGRFFSPATGELDMAAVLFSLIEIAQGMEYIHDLNLVHGDVKGRNVLLKSARLDRRGFTCKIADFGLSRMLEAYQTHVDTASYGTPSHAAPELLGEGKASKASDVYAFAIIMWEMVSGEEAHSELSTFQLMALMSRKPDSRPPIPPTCPPPLEELIRHCWQTDPAARPSFAEVVQELQGMLREARQRAEGRAGSSQGRGSATAAAATLSQAGSD